MHKYQTISLHPGVKLQSKERTYEIVKVLGAGSYGITYLATATIPIGNISTTINFAIKEYFLSDSCYRGDDGITVHALPKEKSTVASNRIDFINEANRLKKICHKSRNIVSVNETFEANGTAYYVMEYLDGGNPTKCTEDEAISIVQQIADALEIIHQDGIIHMDLRPDNIVMKTTEKNGTYPVLIDFGISLYFDSKGKSETTLTIKGASPGYAPPEQVSRKCKFSPQYDIYALGAVLFYLCTGKTPPKASDISPDQTQLREVLDGRVSANVETAILNVMKPDAEERTRNIQKFRDDLMGVTVIPTLEISTKTLYLNNEKSQQSVNIDSNIDWTAYSDEGWCSLSKTTDSLLISVLKNSESGPRTCNIFINGVTEKISQSIQVNQSGEGTVVFHDDDTRKEQNRKKVYAGIGSLVLLACIVGLYIHTKPSSSSDSERIADSDSLYIAKQEISETLEPPIESHQSSSDQEVSPLPVNESNHEEETNASKFSRASMANDLTLMFSLAKDNYTKAYYPLSLMYFDKKDMVNARLWAQRSISANVNRAKATELLKRITSLSQGMTTSENVSDPTQSASSDNRNLDKQLNEALKDPLKGMATLVKLALHEQFPPAYYPYAKQLLKSGKTDEAKELLRLSIENGANVSQAKELLETLEE